MERSSVELVRVVASKSVSELAWDAFVSVLVWESASVVRQQRIEREVVLLLLLLMVVPLYRLGKR